VAQQNFIEENPSHFIEPSITVEPLYENEVIEVADPTSAVNAPQQFVLRNPCLRVRESFTVADQDEIWFVSARDFIDGETNVEGLKVSQAVDGDLKLRSLTDLTGAHQSGDQLSTLIYVHGNQTDEDFALFRGFQVYRNLLATTAGSRVPVRYTLNQFSDQNMVVFGYSLGVQVLLSAFDSPDFHPRPNDPTQYQVMFAAPAINPKFVACNMLKPGCKFVPIERSMVFTNRKDRAIRVAQTIIRRDNPTEESTIIGLSNAGKLNVGSVMEVDVFEEAGRFHSVERYTRSETLQSVTADFLSNVASQKTKQPLVCE